MTRPANPRYGKSRPADSTAAGRGVWMISLTRMVGSSAGREPVRDASRICAARLQALGASTQQPPRGSPHLAHARRKRARERCRPSFRQCTGWLGQMTANHRSKDTGIPDCEKSKPRLGKCTSAKRSYGAGRPLRRSGPAHFGSYRTSFHSYRASSVIRSGLGCCVCCHRLLFE